MIGQVGGNSPLITKSIMVNMQQHHTSPQETTDAQLPHPKNFCFPCGNSKYESPVTNNDGK